MKILLNFISKRFKKISEENTNYAWIIKLTKILIKIIPLSEDDKLELFNKIIENLIDENNTFLLELNSLKFGNYIYFYNFFL